MVHRFETVHRVVAPDKSFALNAILLALHVNWRSRLAVPTLRAVVCWLVFLDEVQRLVNRFFGFTRKAHNEGTERENLAIVQVLHAISVPFDGGRLIHVFEDGSRARLDP